jgi:hypothetical protein
VQWTLWGPVSSKSLTPNSPIAHKHPLTSTRSVVLLINFADRGKSPTIATSKTILSFLQDHYPERLGFAIFINVPFIVTTTLKIIMPFVDPITREKIKFNHDIFEEGIFHPDMVMEKWWGGSQDFDYVHEKCLILSSYVKVVPRIG